MTYRLRNIVLAVALAALAAMLTSFYVANYKRSVQADEANVSVYVAAKQIPSGTAGEDAVARGYLRTAEVARRNVVPGAISSPKEIQELVATETVYEGEQVSVRRFRSVAAAGIRSDLKGNLRALQIAGDANQILAGTLDRGDRVDVIGNFQISAEGGGESSATRVVLRDLLVLYAPSSPSVAASKVGSKVGSGWVQLAVTDAQAQKLFFVTRNGAWTLQLRPVVDAADSPETLETIETVLCDGMRRAISVCSGRNP